MFIKEIVKNRINEKKNDRIKRILDIASFDSVNNVHPESVNSIGIVVPELHKFTGGHTSIIRLGSLLVERGYEVSYISYDNQPIQGMSDVLKANYSHAKGSCISFEQAKIIDFDLILATNWISVYWAKLLKGYKVYFVQDYEPYFFMVDEEYELAKETYELGFHIISLGKWNIEQINKFCLNRGLQSFIDFPYEPSEYQYEKKEFKKKKDIKIAVYTKENGKRMANLMQYMLLKAKNELGDRGYHLDITFFGLDNKYKVIVGHNHGRLNKTEMHQLYLESDFGFVASMTNISLVPYEMIGSGLPVIEFKTGSYTSFLPKQSAILVDYNYLTLADALENYINNPKKTEELTIMALDAVKHLSWENSCNQFVEIINNEIIETSAIL